MRINRSESPQGHEEKKAQAPAAAPQRAARPVKQSSAEPRRAAFDFDKEMPAKPVKRDAPPARRKPQPARKERVERYEEETPRRSKGCLLGIILLVVLLAGLAFGAYKVLGLYRELDGRSTLGAEQTFTVAQGATVASIAAQLEEEGIIDNGWLFKYYAKYSGKATGMQYGDFLLRPGMSYNDIIKALSEQKVRRKTTTVTIPEGSCAVAVAQAMEAAGLCTVQEFLDCANGADGSDFSQYAFWSQIPDNGRLMKCEGYLFPNTYEFYLEDEVYNYVNTFYKEFDKQIAGLTDTIAAKGTTIDEVVILASFIQEEAGMAVESNRVSACFHNRLESSDPLWSAHCLESNACSYLMHDYENNYLWNSPMAEYMGWTAQGAIPEDVLAIYDTYKISGLPAGPISCPGYFALEASLNPDQEYLEGGYYFFVTGHPESDIPGQYLYAKTADEHAANVRRAGWSS